MIIDHSMTRVERESLELAGRKCVGVYGVDHLSALRRLEEAGLVRGVRTAKSAWYEPTEEGWAILARPDPDPAGG
jgi:hypothetical protein